MFEVFSPVTTPVFTSVYDNPMPPISPKMPMFQELEAPLVLCNSKCLMFEVLKEYKALLFFSNYRKMLTIDLLVLLEMLQPPPDY